MQVILAKICLLICLTCSTSALNLLGIFPYHGKSHHIVFRVLLQELVRKGHNLTVISHFPEKNVPNNYQEIILSGVNHSKHAEDSLPVQRSLTSLFDVGIYLSSTGMDNCEQLLANGQVRNLVEQKPKFDVILVEQFNSDCALGLAYKFSAPVVGLTSHVMMPWHYKRYGIPYNPSYVSFHFLEGGTRPTFVQRLQRVFFEAFFRSLFFYVTRHDQNTLAQYYDDIPSLEDLTKEIKFLLINHHFTLTGSSLLPANVIEVGGYHVADAKPLYGDLKKFVDGAKHGVIYISFGTTVTISNMPQDKFEAVLGAIEELPQRFIWRWDSISMDNPNLKLLPRNLNAVLTNKDKLYLATWLPQIDILGDPKILGFFSHAGMGSTAEAIHYGVPIVAMPIIGDQPANAAAIEESGLGLHLAVNDLTKEKLLAALQKILDPTFKNRVKQISKAWHDRPLSPLDTAVFWIEYAARNSNFTYRSRAADVSLYQYYGLDGAIVLLAMLITVFLSIKAITRHCAKKPQKRNETITKKKKNK